MNAFFREILTHLQSAFDPAGIAAQIADLFSALVVGGAIILVYWLVWRVLRRVLTALFDRSSVDLTLRSFVQLFLKYALGTVAIVQVLGTLGINTGALLTSLGVAGLTIGFAAQDSLSNVISGLFIFWDRPFVIGDLVETGDHYGRVDSISLRSTRVVTPDGRMLSIPNSAIVNATVASYTNFPHLRLDLPIQIGVNESIPRVRAILTDLAARDADLMDTPAPVVVVTDLGDYNVTVSWQVWLRDERLHAEKRTALREAAYDALNAAGVDMPFETLALRPVEVTARSA